MKTECISKFADSVYTVIEYFKRITPTQLIYELDDPELVPDNNKDISQERLPINNKDLENEYNAFLEEFDTLLSTQPIKACLDIINYHLANILSFNIYPERNRLKKHDMCNEIAILGQMLVYKEVIQSITPFGYYSNTQDITTYKTDREKINYRQNIHQADNLNQSMDTSITTLTECDSKFPSCLQNDKAKAIFSRAIEAGLMEPSEAQYKWKNSKQLLAYFCAKFSDYMGLGKKEYNGKKEIKWSIFEPVFGIKELRKTQSEFGRTTVIDQDKVDEIFEEKKK